MDSRHLCVAVTKPLCFLLYLFQQAPSSECLYPTSFWGPTCDGLDKICDTTFPELYLGDFVYFDNMGAYTVAASSSFNGFQRPKSYYYIDEEKLWVLPLSLSLFPPIPKILFLESRLFLILTGRSLGKSTSYHLSNPLRLKIKNQLLCRVCLRVPVQFRAKKWTPCRILV